MSSTVSRGNTLIKNGEIYVAVELVAYGKYVTPTWRWKRKALIVIEQALQRSLTWGEQRLIAFVDGNKMNTNLENLVLLESTRKELVCEVCGKVRSLYTSVMSKKCFGCHVSINLEKDKLGRASGSKFDAVDTSCIKALKEVVCADLVCTWYGVHRQTVYAIWCFQTWKEVKPMAKEEVYKGLLKRHEVLVAKGNTNLWDRVTLLVQVFEDPYFLSDMKEEGKDPIRLLNDRLSDTCTNFTVLREMLKVFPKRTEWESGNLVTMKEETLRKLREALDKGKKGKQQPPRTRPTFKDVDELKTQVVEQTKEVSALKEELSKRPTTEQIVSLTNRTDSDAQVIAKLKKEIKAKDRRIAQLETQLDQANAKNREQAEQIAAMKQRRTKVTR